MLWISAGVNDAGDRAGADGEVGPRKALAAPACHHHVLRNEGRRGAAGMSYSPRPACIERQLSSMTLIFTTAA